MVTIRMIRNPARTALLFLPLALAACAITDNVAPSPQVKLPAAFDQPSPGAATPNASLAQWWTAWHDPILNRLVAEAVASNADLRVARAHVAEARAMVSIAESALYPTVAAQGAGWAGAADWRGGAVDLLPTLASGIDAHAIGLAASWEPDVFGAHADDIAAARASTEAVDAQAVGARLTIIADVVENYQEARGLQRRLVALDEALTTLHQLVTYAEARYSAGQAVAFDVALIHERLHSTQAQRPMLLALLDSRRRRLAVLCGLAPESAPTLSAAAPFTLPAAPSGQIPSTVLERRPDVMARADLVRAQLARLASAKTDLLPKFEVQFLGQDGHLHLEGIPGFAATSGLVGLDVNLPIFTAGRIHANIAANNARLDAAAAEYDQAMLKALEDVENAYGLRFGLDRRAEDEAEALTLARHNESTATGLYEGGRKALEDVLKAKLDAYDREDALIQTQMGQATATVQLYRALGGGWSN